MAKAKYTGKIRIDCPAAAIDNLFTARAYHDPAPKTAPPTLGPVVATGQDANRDAAIAKCVAALATTAEGDLTSNARTINPP